MLLQDETFEAMHSPSAFDYSNRETGLAANFTQGLRRSRVKPDTELLADTIARYYTRISPHGWG